MTQTRRPCPYCAEDIAVEAVRCPHCRSRLVALDPTSWHRDLPERKIAGVAAALSRAFAVPVALVRAAFVLLTFVHFTGVMAYVALWAVIPARPGEPSPLERFVARVRTELERFWSGGSAAGGGAPPPSRPENGDRPGPMTSTVAELPTPRPRPAA